MRTLAVCVAALLMTGCPGSQPENEAQNAPPKSSTTVSNPQANPERTARSNPIVPSSRELPSSRIPAAATPMVEVQLIEYEIRMPDTIPAGHQTLHIANAGKQKHNFAIEGNDVAVKLASDLSRGNTNDLAIDLRPGTYTVYCPVDKHRGKGMEKTITVQPHQ